MRKSPIKKRSKNPLSVLRKKAWRIFGFYIKERDNYKCFTCGDYGNQAGHFIHRDCLDFDEKNINCQCVRCNHFLSGNLGEYALRLIKKYGLAEVEKLRKKANTPKGFTKEELEKIIKKYS